MMLNLSGWWLVIAFLYSLLLAVVVFLTVYPATTPRVFTSKADLAKSAHILLIDPDILLKQFIEDRGLSLEGDAFSAAIQRLDALVAQVAEETYTEYGVLVVKSDLVLAGGVDYTPDFYARVLQLWDAAL